MESTYQYFHLAHIRLYPASLCKQQVLSQHNSPQIYVRSHIWKCPVPKQSILMKSFVKPNTHALNIESTYGQTSRLQTQVNRVHHNENLLILVG